MSSAMKPPRKKNRNDVTRYSRPMSLWSVVRSTLRNIDPLATSCSGNGWLTIGWGSRLVGSGASAAVGSAVVGQRASRSDLPDGPDVGGRVRPAAGFRIATSDLAAAPGSPLLAAFARAPRRRSRGSGA